MNTDDGIRWSPHAVISKYDEDMTNYVRRIEGVERPAGDQLPGHDRGGEQQGNAESRYRVPVRRAVAVGALAVLAAGCGGDSPCGATEATVTRVVDGDTIELDDGRKIRYLLVDTPESTGGAMPAASPSSATPAKAQKTGT